MKDCADWEFILNFTDALFYRIAIGIGVRADMSLADCHEEYGHRSSRGVFGWLAPMTASASSPIDDARRSAMEQNKPLANYRR